MARCCSFKAEMALFPPSFNSSSRDSGQGTKELEEDSSIKGRLVSEAAISASRLERKRLANLRTILINMARTCEAGSLNSDSISSMGRYCKPTAKRMAD